MAAAPPLAVRILKLVLALFLPPLAVFLQAGIGGTFFLNVLLTLLGHIPGVVHALLVVSENRQS